MREGPVGLGVGRGWVEGVGGTLDCEEGCRRLGICQERVKPAG